MTLVGCGSKKIEGKLPDLLDQIYKNIEADQLPMMLTTTEITSENQEYYLGSNQIEYKEAIVSESQVGSIPYSLVLLRIKEGADVEKVKQQIKDSVNPAKWICVAVEEKNVMVENKRDLIILIMSNDIAKDLQQSFEKLK